MVFVEVYFLHNFKFCILKHVMGIKDKFQTRKNSIFTFNGKDKFLNTQFLQLLGKDDELI